MIGMMNGGPGDAPVDFYSTPKLAKGEERLYIPQQREIISYTKDGRVMLDGQLVVTETPEELWQDLIMRVVWYRLCKDHLDVKEFKMPKERTFRNFFRLKASCPSPKPSFHNGKAAYSQPKNVAAATTTTTTTTASTDPKTGAHAITKTTTTLTPNGKTSSSQSFTSVFLRKQKFCASGNSAYPHSKRVVGK